MNAIRQHIPNFIEGVDRITTAFDTVEELLEIPWVKRWSEPVEPIELVNLLDPEEKVDPPKQRGPFHRYSVSHQDRTLMAEYDEGKHWMVIGFIRDPIEGLPKWEPKDV